LDKPIAIHFHQNVSLNSILIITYTYNLLIY
jgi:hypothetical protein